MADAPKKRAEDIKDYDPGFVANLPLKAAEYFATGLPKSAAKVGQVAGTAAGHLGSPLLRREFKNKTKAEWEALGKKLQGTGKAVAKRAKPEANKLIESIGAMPLAESLGYDKIW